MVSSESPRNRGVNCAVRFDIASFTERFFALLDVSASFRGPGPIEATRMGYRPASERFAINHLLQELFSKYDDGVKSSAKRDRAIRKFEEGEILCALTNQKFGFNSVGQLPQWLDPLTPSDDPELEVDAAVFRRAKSVISRVLGSFPGWEAILLHADFGPGATTRLNRSQAHRSNKWGGQPHIGLQLSSLAAGLPEALPLLKKRVRHGDTWHECVAGNKLDWVPKNYKVDRTIAIEPDLSMFLQKGMGRLLRKRLKRVKQDLDNQETNGFLAFLGSVDGSLATLDLSMASDTVSYNLARYLIRPDWFEALDLLRSQVGFYSHGREEHCVVYEKLSSMGNGFTFEVESLIFYGILRAVSELSEQSDHRLYVYGDDIVVPTGMADLAMTYLRKAGFVVNKDKSFWTGPFRESCGVHYFSGVDVTPFYVREEVSHLDRLFLLHNNVYRWLNRHPYICDPTAAREFLAWIRSFAPEKWQRPRLLTEDVGDGAFIGSFDEVLPSCIGKSKNRFGWEGWRSETLQFRSKRTKHHVPKKSKRRQRHPWGAFKAPDDYATPPEYSAGQDPILERLWALEGSDLRYKMWYQPQDAGFDWAKSKDFVDWLLPSQGGADVPDPEREWYVAIQVLPFASGASWW